MPTWLYVYQGSLYSHRTTVRVHSHRNKRCEERRFVHGNKGVSEEHRAPLFPDFHLRVSPILCRILPYYVGLVHHIVWSEALTQPEPHRAPQSYIKPKIFCIVQATGSPSPQRLIILG